MRRVGLVLILAASAAASRFYVYVGDAGPNHVSLAWGTADGIEKNTIGRDAESRGEAVVSIGGRTLRTSRTWTIVDGLEPDTDYAYTVALNGSRIGEGSVRTWPRSASRLTFIVIGDWGNGGRPQARIAEAMWRTVLGLERSPNPVRFVLTTGDNLYAEGPRRAFSGHRDAHWERKFFAPYEPIIARIPFYPTPGNHDGNATEARGDLAAYLDNFFFPGMKAARWYHFSYGGFADFFALDSTKNTLSGPPAAVYLPGGDQFRWLETALGSARAPWRIAYFHHPPLSAGPRHAPSLRDLGHFVNLFDHSGVSVVFSGHEHNFQFSKPGGPAGSARYIVTGAAGELRRRSIRHRMDQAHIEGWAAQHHFLMVEIEEREARITPLSWEPVVVRDRSGQPIPMPLLVRR